MKHVVKLSNGQNLVIEESTDAINIGLGEKTNYVDTENLVHDIETDAHICQINCNGVLVYTNTGDACIKLARKSDRENSSRIKCFKCFGVTEYICREYFDVNTNSTMIAVSDYFHDHMGYIPACLPDEKDHEAMKNFVVILEKWLIDNEKVSLAIYGRWLDGSK
jgi:hypothetical protein